MSYEYRWIVRVESDITRPCYAREVMTEGPSPDEAAISGLARITKSGDDDLWRRDELTIRVERVR